MNNSFIFSPDAHALFARLSGDWNPIHMDSLAARRTQAGVPLVHGMHLAVRCLDSIAAQLLLGSVPVVGSLAALNIRFTKPVHVGDLVHFVQATTDTGDIRVQARVDGLVVASLGLTISEFSIYTPNDAAAPPTDIPRGPHSPENLSFEQAEKLTGTVGIPANSQELADQFADVAKWIGTARLAALLGLSRLVGMSCPGLHSMFSRLSLEFIPDSGKQPTFLYSVLRADSRFRLFTISVAGLGMQGRVEAFMRQPPALQPSLDVLASHLQPLEFAGQNVLIVGGSRGLGELTAKFIAAGGGTPYVTYAVGRAEAERLQHEIREHGAECEILPYDVRRTAADQIADLPPIDQMYYYATSQIFRRKKRAFEVDVLEEFNQFYVYGFHDLCMALMDRAPHRLSAFYPSSSALDTRPRDMTEYTMAKAAGEVLCADLSRFVPDLTITSFRLPRLATDQTATITPVPAEDAVETLLPLIRKVQRNEPIIPVKSD